VLGGGNAVPASKEEDLKALRNRIDALSRELEKKEEVRKEARDGLRESERAISAANRALTELRAEGDKVRGEAAAIATRRALLERSLAEREQAVGRMVAARQANRAPDALRVALSGEDPAAVARGLHYLSYLARASATMLADYRATLAEAARLAGEAQAKRARLDALQTASRADREKLLAERRERRRVLDQVAGEVRKSRKEIKVMRADAARLAHLVEELAALLPAQARKEPFSKLRGRLSLPVRGELSGRFGAPRGAAGTEAKGLFIRAPQGQPVRAIAGGEVVYAEWMRGFGNLLILDHGEAYLSIYANNESLLKQVGDAVTAGETVATTGASGGNEETGLYFEMRHLGRAFDPLRWVKLNK
jgi:septal ring factor EnvC (AmiA/AmiB activator)